MIPRGGETDTETDRQTETERQRQTNTERVRERRRRSRRKEEEEEKDPSQRFTRFPILIVKEMMLRSHEKTSVSSIQFKMASIRSEKYIYDPSLLSEVSPTLPLKQCHYSSDSAFLCLSRKVIERFQMTDGVMSLALCPQVVSQAPQHIRSSETYVIRDGCLAVQFVCSVITFDSCISRAVHPQEI